MSRSTSPTTPFAGDSCYEALERINQHLQPMSPVGVAPDGSESEHEKLEQSHHVEYVPDADYAYNIQIGDDGNIIEPEYLPPPNGLYNLQEILGNPTPGTRFHKETQHLPTNVSQFVHCWIPRHARTTVLEFLRASIPISALGSFASLLSTMSDDMKRELGLFIAEMNNTIKYTRIDITIDIGSIIAQSSPLVDWLKSLSAEVIESVVGMPLDSTALVSKVLEMKKTVTGKPEGKGCPRPRFYIIEVFDQPATKGLSPGHDQDAQEPSSLPRAELWAQALDSPTLCSKRDSKSPCGDWASLAGWEGRRKAGQTPQQKHFIRRI